MDNETKTDVVADTKDNTTVDTEVETISIPKSEYDKTLSTLGSLKRELKDLKKPKEETQKETTVKTDINPVLEKLEKLSFRTAGVTHPDDMELARSTAKKWNADIDDVLADPDFLAKLGRQQAGRANVEATSNVRGGAGTSQAKNTPEYWIAKGTPPTPSDVPDRKTRAKIIRAVMASSKTNGKKFYND